MKNLPKLKASRDTEIKEPHEVVVKSDGEKKHAEEKTNNKGNVTT